MAATFASLLIGMNKHGGDCAQFAFDALADSGYDLAAIELSKVAAHQQIADDVLRYGAGQAKPKTLRVLTIQAQQAYDRHFAKLMAERSTQTG